MSYRNQQFEGYGKTYIDYIMKGEKNGISDDRWKQTFAYNLNGALRASYQDLIEAGTILEDAQWPHGRGIPEWQDKADGRFINHFYDAQHQGRGLYWFGFEGQNALTWAQIGEASDAPSPAIFSHIDNDYCYSLALEYFYIAFTESNPSDRKRYQAKLFVTLGHLLHMLNDMTSPSHVRNDMHAEGDPYEVWARGGEHANLHIGYRIIKNSWGNYAGVNKLRSVNIPKYTSFSNFMTKEAQWTATHFFSKDTVFSKPHPAKSETYEDYAGTYDGVKKYYIRSYGNGSRSCSNGCVPTGTKLAIQLRSYVINALGKKYYYQDKSGMNTDEKNRLNALIDGIGETTTYRGDLSVLEDGGKVLLPRAIANARNFLNYFFRVRFSVEITNDMITITNRSDPNVLGNRGDAYMNGTFVFKYYANGQWHDFKYIRYDVGRLDGSVAYIGGDTFVPLLSQIDSTQPFAPGQSIHAAIKTDSTIRSIIRNHPIMVVYKNHDGYRSNAVGVCNAKRTIYVSSHST